MPRAKTFTRRQPQRPACVLKASTCCASRSGQQVALAMFHHVSPTLRSSGRSPGYRGTPLNSNVGQNTMPEMHNRRSVRLRRLLCSHHLSPPERAVRPTAAKRTGCGCPWSAAGESEAFNDRSLRLRRLLAVRQPSPLAWAVRPAAAKRTVRGLRLNASRQDVHAPATTAARLRFKGEHLLRLGVWAASGSGYVPPRQPNPSFERTFPGVPWPAAQLKLQGLPRLSRCTESE